MQKIRNYTEPEEHGDGYKHLLLPKRLLITGLTGYGKTNLLLNFIYDFLTFDRLYICAKDIEEPMYAKLRENYAMFDGIQMEDIRKSKRLNKKEKEDMLVDFHKFKKDHTFSSDLVDLDRSIRNLVVFDDCVTKKDQKSIEDLFIRGRQKNTSIIYLSQSYYSTPLNIRKNCSYLVFFKLQPREIQQILREVDESLTKEELRALYKQCLQEPYDFFMLDLVNQGMRYRRNFQPINKEYGRQTRKVALHLPKEL